MHSTAEMGVNSVPAFLTKIWTLVDDPETDELISWDPSGLSFHVHDQGRFAKEILPHYFKHSNIASFVRQLNMYGFRKVVHVDSGSIKRETDAVEFHHPYFVRGQEGLLEHIKRKTSQPQVTSSTLRTEAGLKFSHDDVTRVLNDVQLMKGKQEAFTSKMDKMKKENEALWREVASLRQKHVKQQQIVNKLIQFMIHLVGANRNTLSNTGIPKRKMPLMIGDSSQVPSPKKPRYTKQLSIEEVPDPQYDYIIKSPDSIPKPDSTDNLAYTTGPIIHDVTDSISPISTSSTSRLNSPGKLTTTTAVPMKLPTRTNTDYILHSNIDTSQGLNLSSSDLNELVQNIDPAILDRSLDTNTTNLTDNIGTVDIPDKSQLNTQLDTLQFEIDSLKDMMTGDHFNFDPATILPLFNTDSSVPVSIENLLGELDSSPLQTAQIPPQQSSGSIMGNELVQYQTPSELGIPDLSDIISIDPLHEEEQESEPIDPMSFINTNPVPVSQDDLSLDTPLNKDGEI